MFDVALSEQASSYTTYKAYPINKPFINSECVIGSQNLLSKAFPESNRDLIINSLKKLQEKISRLELTEKRLRTNFDNSSYDHHVNDEQATHQLQTESNVYAAYPIINNQLVNDRNVGHLNQTIEDEDDEKIVNTEKRVKKLEQQLTKMRQLLNDYSSAHELELTHLNHTIENNKSEFINRLISNATYHADSSRNKKSKKIRSKAATFTSSKDKRRDSDEFFVDHRSSKCTIDYEMDDMENSKPIRSKIHLNNVRNSDLASNQNLIKNTFSIHRSRSFEPLVNCRKKSKANQTVTTTTNPHYRLNLGDIPFVVGKSTTPSHHLGSNIQNVISLLKMHHPKICSGHANKSQIEQHQSNYRNHRNYPCIDKVNIKTTKYSIETPVVGSNHLKNKKASRTRTMINASRSASHPDLNRSNEKATITTTNSSNYDSTSSGEFDLNELLRTLQEDYTRLVLQHYEITKKLVNGTSLDENRDELEYKAECLHRKMKSKAKQINKLKNLRQNKIMKKSFKKLDMDLENVDSTLDKCWLEAQDEMKLIENHANRHKQISNNHSKTLRLFKEIKFLQEKIQKDEI